MLIHEEEMVYVISNQMIWHLGCFFEMVRYREDPESPIMMKFDDYARVAQVCMERPGKKMHLYNTIKEAHRRL